MSQDGGIKWLLCVGRESSHTEPHLRLRLGNWCVNLETPAPSWTMSPCNSTQRWVTCPPREVREMSQYTSTQCQWNVTMHFHPVLGWIKCHHALPPSAGSVSAAEGSSHQPCVALEQLSHSFFINSTSKRPGISTTSDRSRVWWLSEGEGEPPRRKRTPFWKSHTPLDSWGLGLSRHGWGVQNGVRFRRGAEEGGQRTCPTRLNQNFLPA